MKRLLLPFTLIIVVLLGGFYLENKLSANKVPFLDSRLDDFSRYADKDILRNGDIIFQTSVSGQSKAIQIATKSKYSHCGLVLIDDGRYFVFEAGQPVKKMPLQKWIAKGEGGHYVVKRLKNADQILTPEILQKMKKEGQKFANKNYDKFFGWGDERIYCSELVWKIYERATGLEIGKLQKLGEFDLTHQTVQKILQRRYKGQIPLEEPVISPQAIFESDLLITVKSN